MDVSPSVTEGAEQETGVHNTRVWAHMGTRVFAVRTAFHGINFFFFFFGTFLFTTFFFFAFRQPKRRNKRKEGRKKERGGDAGAGVSVMVVAGRMRGRTRGRTRAHQMALTLFGFFSRDKPAVSSPNVPHGGGGCWRDGFGVERGCREGGGGGRWRIRAPRRPWERSAAMGGGAHRGSFSPSFPGKNNKRNSVPPPTPTPRPLFASQTLCN